MNIIKKIFIIIALLTLIVFITTFFLGNIVKKSVTMLAPKLIGVEVALKRVDISFLSSKVIIDDLSIRNLKYFDSENIFHIKNFDINMPILGIFKDSILINKLFLNSLEFTYEIKNGKTNIIKMKETIKKHLDSNNDNNESDGNSSNKKLLKINHFIMFNSKIHIVVEGVKVEKNLPRLEIKSVEGRFLSPDQIIDKIISNLLLEMKQNFHIDDIIKNSIHSKIDVIENKVKKNIKKYEDNIKKEIDNNILKWGDKIINTIK